MARTSLLEIKRKRGPMQTSLKNISNKEISMKKFTLGLITIMGLMVASAVAALADSGFSGNQLTQAYVPWYQKAADTVGPVDKAAKRGLVLQAGSFLYLEGDSTLHKYQMHANALLGSAVLKNPKGDLAKALKSDGVDSMELVVPLDNLEIQGKRPGRQRR